MAKSPWTWSDDEGGFVTRLRLPRLQAWRNRWHVWHTDVQGPFDDEETQADAVEVVLLGPIDEDGEPRPRARPTKAQVAASQLLTDEEAAIDEALAHYLLQAVTSPDR